MSERRTELIRVRLTPSEKAQWEAAAVREDVAVSELIRSAVESHVWAEQNKSLGGMLDGAILATRIEPIVEVEPEVAAKLRETFGPKPNAPEVERCCANICTKAENCQHPLRRRDSEDHPLASTQTDTRCPHGSPPWAFCGTCFEAGVTR